MPNSAKSVNDTSYRTDGSACDLIATSKLSARARTGTPGTTLLTSQAGLLSHWSLGSGLCFVPTLPLSIACLLFGLILAFAVVLDCSLPLIAFGFSMVSSVVFCAFS